MKNIVIISSTPRMDGNSELLSKAFMKGAIESKNNVELISLRDYNLGYCHSCYKCESDGLCFQNDGMNELANKLIKADVIVFSTPVYFYTMSGQLKVFIDRLLPYYTKIKADIYIMCTAWDSNTKNLELTIESIRGCTRDCFSNCVEKGVIMAGGCEKKGDINSKEELKIAYNMGRNC